MVTLYDRLAKVLYDEERRVEYPAWTCFNDSNTADRVKVSGAKEVVYAVVASTKLNSDIAICMRDTLTSGRIDLLPDYQYAVDDILSKMPEYNEAADADTMLFYERPYLETRELIGEMVELEYEFMKDTGLFKLYETSNNTKDRYTAVSYGNYFASLLENDLMSEGDDYESTVFIN